MVVQGNWLKLGLGILLLAGIAFYGLHRTAAYNGRDMAVLNVAVPMLQAGYRAHRHRRPVGDAILQALVGGLMMQKAFELAGDCSENTPAKAWRAKLLLNTGASLCESAGDRFCYRMDLGPVWLLADEKSLRIRLGLHSTVAPLLNANDGARFDWKRSLQFGTVAFWRPQKADGTIGSNGALAYSNANNFITDARGAHLGHELVHTFQYRRDTMMGPNISSMNSRFARALGDRFVDDTAWSIDWGLQCFWSDLKFQDKDFDIPMEREAYFISGKSN